MLGNTVTNGLSQERLCQGDFDNRCQRAEPPESAGRGDEARSCHCLFWMEELEEADSRSLRGGRPTEALCEL